MNKDANGQLPHPFSEAISRIIKEKGITKYRIAKNLGKQVTEITRIERQHGAPKWDTLFLLAKGMEIAPREIFQKVCDVMAERSKTDQEK